MSVHIILLDADQAQELRLQALAVLRSVTARPTCECGIRAWRGEDGYCAKCGKWISNLRTIKALRRKVESLDKIQEYTAARDRERRARAGMANEETVLHLDPSYAERTAA